MTEGMLSSCEVHESVLCSAVALHGWMEAVLGSTEALH